MSSTPLAAAKLRDSSLRSSAGFAGSGVLGLHPLENH